MVEFQTVGFGKGGSFREMPRSLPSPSPHTRSAALGPWSMPLFLILFLSLTGTQREKCHRVGLRSFLTCLVFERSSHLGEWWTQGEGFCLVFQDQKRVDWVEWCVGPGQGQW